MFMLLLTSLLLLYASSVQKDICILDSFLEPFYYFIYNHIYLEVVVGNYLEDARIKGPYFELECVYTYEYVLHYYY